MTSGLVRRRILPCACGHPVTANPIDPVPGMRAHRATLEHEAWSAAQWRALTPEDTAGPLTIDRLRELGLVSRPTEAHNTGVGVSDALPYESVRLPLTPVVGGPTH